MTLSNFLPCRFDRAFIITWLWRVVLPVLLCLRAAPAQAQQPPKIDRVIIEGNELISEKQIRRLLVTRPTGWLFNRKRFDPVTFTADKEAIETFYQNSGFLDARVVDLQTLSDDGQHVIITIRIREGPRYLVKAVNIIGNEVITEAEIQPLLLSGAGDPFFRLFMATDRRTLQLLAEQKALLDAVIQNEAIVDADTTVMINFTIQEGLPISVGDIRVQGLQKTRTDVVLRELTIQPGELYDTAKLIRSRTQLFQTGLFRSIRMEPLVPDSVSATRDLLVSVTELPGGEIEIGGGFASVEGMRGSFGIAQRNWQGRGISVGSRVQASSLIQQADASYTQPWLFHTRTTGTARGFFDRQDLQSHDRRRIGVSFTASRELSLAFRSQTAYTLENVNVSGLDSTLALLVATGELDSLESRRDGSLTQNIIYDTRDDILNTTRGVFVQLQGNISSRFLGSSSGDDDSILSTTGTIRKYFPFGKFPDFATSWTLRYVRPLSDDRVPLDKRLFLGGDKSVRGFDVDKIGQPLGGVVAVSSQNEMRIPLPGVVLAGYIDFGGVGPSVQRFSINDIRFGYGGGLRIMTPIGLIRGDVGFHRFSEAHENPEDDRTFYYFGLGQAF